MSGAPEACNVLGGTFALLIQAALFAVTCAVLIWKKCVEHSDRTWFEFLLDSSKQIAGAGWIHVANLLCALLFNEEFASADECTLYAANILLDTTLGVGIEWCLLMGVQAMLSRLPENVEGLLKSGSYSDRKGHFRLAAYASQLVVWLLIVTLMKLLVVALMQIAPGVVYAVHWILQPVASSPKAKLVVVMIAIPVAMNSLQFVLTDAFIKRKGHRPQDAEDEPNPSESDADAPAGRAAVGRAAPAAAAKAGGGAAA